MFVITRRHFLRIDDVYFILNTSGLLFNHAARLVFIFFISMVDVLLSDAEKVFIIHGVQVQNSEKRYRVKWPNAGQDRIPDNFGLHKNAIKPIKPVFLLQKRVFCILNKEFALCILSFILNDVSPPTSKSGKFDLGRWVGFSYFLNLDWVSIHDIAKSRKIREWGSK